LTHKFLKLRHRHFLTRQNTLRLRYVSLFAFACFAIVAGVVIPQTSSLALQGVWEPDTVSDVAVAADIEREPVPLGQPEMMAIQNKVSSAMRLAPSALKKAEKSPYMKVVIESGDTVAGVLQNAGLSGRESYFAVKALSEHFNPRHVKKGQEIGLHFAQDPESGEMVFDKMAFILSPVKSIVVEKEGEDVDYVASLDEKELKRRTYGRYAEIETSLYGSAARASIPSPIIAEMIRIYSWDIDFQRDIRRGDRVEVLYESFETEDGAYSKNGDILYASLHMGGKELPIYRFEMDDGRIDYFEPDGTSIRKTLMKTPVDGARISSGYGMRKHPILGYNKMHKGVDFAAPTGTPIYAAGDGVIEARGRKGAYGHYVRIRHNSKLKTAYAHLSRYKKGLKVGSRVEQGDVIGYVGSTGRSTGPHLHYEVLVHGRQVNPRSVDLPTGEILTGEQLRRFKSLRQSLDRDYAAMTKPERFAFLRQSSDDES